MSGTSSSLFEAPASRFLPVSGGYPAIADSASAALFEFDESDLWSSPAALAEKAPAEARAEMKRWMSSARAPKKAEAPRRQAGVATSMPVNIPDWSRILGAAPGRRETDDEEESELDVGGEEEDDEEDEENRWVPPHEYVARRRRQRGVVSCSVEEGAGRTLKGRDLWRVRDAIWEKIGFQD